MFKYSRDRFVSNRTPYTFYSVQEQRFSHECDTWAANTDFLEPFECSRLRKQQRRAFGQLLSYMSSERDGGHLLNARDRNCPVDSPRTGQEDSAWPVRMVRDRCLARKSYYASKHITADIQLDMPNLSCDWKTRLLDWSRTGYLTAGIESSVHLWSGRTQSVKYTIAAVADEPNDSAKTIVSCLKWDGPGEKLAYSFTTDDGSPSSTLSLSSSSSLFIMSFDSPTTVTAADRPLYASSAGGLSGNGRSLSADTSSSNKRTGKNVPNNYIKVWSLKKHKNNDANNETISTCCGCVTLDDVSRVDCCVIVMDWLANGRVLVTGCTGGTLTFFKHDRRQRRLVTLRVLRNGERDAIEPAFISCLHVSGDKFNRHLAVATCSQRACVLNVWRVPDPPGRAFPFPDASYEDGGGGGGDDDSTTRAVLHGLTRALVDRYETGEQRRGGRLKRVIKAFAWHPWKHSLMCYAVSSIVPNPLLADSSSPTWLVMANACTGQVFTRVEQTACNTCRSTITLSVDVHAMTFSQITGELLVSASTAYKHWKTPNTVPRRIMKHSVVAMQVLDQIVETLNTSDTEKGLFFMWSPDGSCIALTSTEESLRIWNFFPTTVARKKSGDRTGVNPLTNEVIVNTSAQFTDNSYDGRERSKRNNNNNYNWYRNDEPTTSELSLGASWVIR